MRQNTIDGKLLNTLYIFINELSHKKRRYLPFSRNKAAYNSINTGNTSLYLDMKLDNLSLIKWSTISTVEI